VDIELVESVDHVGAFGLYGDVQLLRDVLAVEALAERLKHLFFAGSNVAYGSLGFVLLLGGYLEALFALPELFLGSLRLLFGLLALSDILGDRDKVAWLVRVVVHQGDGQVDPDAPPALADDELLLSISS
jgi:hypothetical protein